MPVVFRDRAAAGRILAERLSAYRGRPDAIVLALPRGGIPVGYEIARALELPLDVFLVRKLGVPGHEELAMGAIASGGVRVLNDDVVEAYGIPPSEIERIAAKEQRELERRERAYRDGRPAPRVTGRVVILVDDGLATGSTMRAAIAALHIENPKRIVVAVPVGAPATCRELAGEVDEMVCAETPGTFFAVGLWYEDFGEVTDAEIHDLLARAHGAASPL